MSDWELEKQARDAVAEAIGNHTVAIDVSRATEEKPSWGTGTFISIKGKFFIVTCRHVVKPQYKSEDLRFLYKLGKSFQWVDKKVITKSSLYEIERIMDKRFPEEIHISNRIYSDDTDDLALLEVDLLVEKMGSYRFFEIKNLDEKTPEVSTQVYLIGFSAELARPVTAKGDIGIFAFYGVTSIIDKEIDSYEYDPRRHFLIDFRTIDNSHSVDPSGLSGCGVWARIASGKDRLWTPNIYLVGVQQSYFKGSQVLKATRIERLIELAK